MPKGEIIDKKWGYEEIIVNNAEYCGKFLNINKGGKSSVHYHKNKRETFHCIKGEVLLNVSGREFIMTEPCTINPSTPHSFLGITDAVILEISTHHDDSDVVRLTESQCL